MENKLTNHSMRYRLKHRPNLMTDQSAGPEVVELCCRLTELGTAKMDQWSSVMRDLILPTPFRHVRVTNLESGTRSSIINNSDGPSTLLGLSVSLDGWLTGSPGWGAVTPLPIKDPETLELGFRHLRRPVRRFAQTVPTRRAARRKYAGPATGQD